jgi:NB-ARC domain
MSSCSHALSPTVRELTAVARAVHAEFSRLPGHACAVLSRRALRVATVAEAPAPRTEGSGSYLLWVDEVFRALKRALVIAEQLRSASSGPPRRPRRNIASILCGVSRTTPAGPSNDASIRAISRTVREWLSAFGAVNCPPDADLLDSDLDNVSNAADGGDVVPRLPSRYVPTSSTEQDALKLLLLRIRDSESESRIACLHGKPGVGKSVMASSLANLDHVAQMFQDGVVWIQLGAAIDDATFARECTGAVGAVLGIDVGAQVRLCPNTSSMVEVVRSNGLQDAQCLIVIDNVTGPVNSGRLTAIVDMANASRPSESKVAILFTTSEDPETVCKFPFERVTMKPLEPLGADANRIFDAHAGLDSFHSMQRSKYRGQVVHAAAGLPLALAIGGGVLRKSDFAWHRLVVAFDESRHGGGVVVCDGEDSVEVLLRWLVMHCEKSFASWLRSLSVLPLGVLVPEVCLSCLWKEDTETTRKIVRRVQRLGLSSVESRSVEESDGLRLHPMVMSFCRMLMAEQLSTCRGSSFASSTSVMLEFEDDIVLTTRNYVEELASRAGFSAEYGPRRVRPWWLLPDDYSKSFLAWHMVRAGMQNELRLLLCEFRWMYNRVSQSGGLRGLTSDFDVLLNSLPTDDASRGALTKLSMVASGLAAASSPSLRNSHTVYSRIAFHVISELGDAQDCVAKHMLLSIARDAKRPFLRPCLMARPVAERLSTRDVKHDGFVSSIETQRTCAGPVLSISVGNDGQAFVYAGDEFASVQATEELSVATVTRGGFVVGGGKHGAVMVCSRDGNFLHSLLGHSRSPVTAITSAPLHMGAHDSHLPAVDETIIVSGAADGSVIVQSMDPDTSVMRSTSFAQAHMDEVCTVAVLSALYDGLHSVTLKVASASFDGFANIYRVDCNEQKHKRLTLAGHRSNVTQLCSLDGGKRAASVCSKGYVYIWDAKSGSCLWQAEVGFEFSSGRALQRFAAALYTHARDVPGAKKRSTRKREQDRVPYLACAGTVDRRELQLMDMPGRSLMASAVFSHPISAIGEAWTRDRFGNEEMRVFVGLANGEMRAVDVVSAVASQPVKAVVHRR